MKKTNVKKIVTLGLAMTVASVPSFASNGVTVKIGGEVLKSDVKAQIIEGRTMLPLRAIFEAMGVDVNYDDDKREITATKDDTVVKIVVDSNVMTVNGESKELDVPAMIVNDRTLVPLRACAESFGMDVKWDDNTKTAKIKKGMWLLESEKSGEENIRKYEYDDNGNKVYENRNGNIIIYKYDEDNRLISIDYSFSQSGGIFSLKAKYNEKNQVIRIDEGNDYSFVTFKYDENGNMIYQEDKDGDWKKYEYDENGNMIYQEDKDGDWEKYEYDENGNLVSSEANYVNPIPEGDYFQGGSEFYGYFVTWYGFSHRNRSGAYEYYEYDENNNNTYYEVVYVYNVVGDVKTEDHWETSDGYWVKTTYDENGNKVYRENSNGYIYSYEYDENGNMIKMKYESTETDENGDIKTYTKITEYTYKYVEVQ